MREQSLKDHDGLHSQRVPDPPLITLLCTSPLHVPQHIKSSIRNSPELAR